MDITKNLFYWFRGPLREGTATRQLENNLTKSLISILEHCDKKVVLRSLLNKLGLKPSADVSFSLQKKPTLADAAGNRVVLAITGGEPDITEQKVKLWDGRPDAWICGPRWTILIESKIGARINSSQLHAHAKAAGWPTGSYQIENISWNAMHHLLRSAQLRLKRTDSVSRLLLAEWLTYLEHQNMTDFEKLDPIDFDFFNLPAEQRRPLLPTMKKRLRAFAMLVSKTAPAKRVARMYDQKDVNQWKYGDPSAKMRGGWFKVGGDPSAHRWHLTVFPGPDGLEITVLNSQTHLTRRLCRSGDTIRKVVAMARKSPELCLSCRRAWYFNHNSPYKGQRIIRTDDPLIVKPAALDKDSVGSCAGMIESTIRRLLKGKQWRTEFQVRRDIPRQKLLKLSSKRQVAMVATALDALGNILACLMDTEGK